MITEVFATSCLILKWFAFYNRNFTSQTKNVRKSIACWALTSLCGNEWVLSYTMECVLSLLWERIWLGMQIKILFWEICCIELQKKSFQSISLVHCWQSSWQQTCLASLSGPCSGFCDRAQSRRIVLWQRSKRALNTWGLCLNGFIRHRRKERWFTCNTSKPLKAFQIWMPAISLSLCCWVGRWDNGS